MVIAAFILPIPLRWPARREAEGACGHDPPIGEHYADLKIAPQRSFHERQIAL
jgi:hypothetical protein